MTTQQRRRLARPRASRPPPVHQPVRLPPACPARFRSVPRPRTSRTALAEERARRPDHAAKKPKSKAARKNTVAGGLSRCRSTATRVKLWAEDVGWQGPSGRGRAPAAWRRDLHPLVRKPRPRDVTTSRSSRLRSWLRPARQRASLFPVPRGTQGGSRLKSASASFAALAGEGRRAGSSTSCSERRLRFPWHAFQRQEHGRPAQTPRTVCCTPQIFHPAFGLAVTPGS